TLSSKFDPSESLNITSSSQNSLYLLAELSSILMNKAWCQILHKLSKLLKPY
ncbi:9108_t:CDS:1, partial [Gigaspora margarita]